MSGASPTGIHGEKETARWVRGMFDRVAGRYDLLNHLLSFQLDRWWRRVTVRRLLPHLCQPKTRVLDLCCGTGDLTIALAAAGPAQIIGADFSRPMLALAQRKGRGRQPLLEADALSLPFADRSLNVVTVAFGFRNLANYHAALQELHRVLAPGGVAAILEFSQPPHALFAGLYRIYSRQIMPRAGAWISGASDAYSYLPESVRKFPGAEELAARMQAAGFSQVSFERLTFGIVALHLGRAA